MKQFNERPSKYSNLGQDITGAKRHNFDTYENPEKKAEKERVKRSKNHLKELKQQAIDQFTEVNYMGVIEWYESNKCLISMANYDGVKRVASLEQLKEHVLSLKETPYYNDSAIKFNKLSKKMRNIRWYYRDVTLAMKHFDTKSKDKFTEFNGVKRPWILKDKFNPISIDYLIDTTEAIQFGNSLPENEREYCLHNLMIAIETLKTRLTFNFKTIGFSYGARGKAGSVAHYQNSQKVLAFNRGWDGALIHELGHAIDYSLNLPSNNLPMDIRQRYAQQIKDHKIDNPNYYNSRKELFARLFEVWCLKNIPELSSFALFIFDQRTMPILDEQSEQWMNDALKPILKGLTNE